MGLRSLGIAHLFGLQLLKKHVEKARNTVAGGRNGIEVDQEVYFDFSAVWIPVEGSSVATRQHHVTNG